MSVDYLSYSVSLIKISARTDEVLLSNYVNIVRNEHVNRLVNQINQLTDFDINKLLYYSLEKLNKWRDDCHHTIECNYEQKSQELKRFILKILDQQSQEIHQIRFQISELIDKQGTTYNDIQSLTSSINISKEKKLMK